MNCAALQGDRERDQGDIEVKCAKRLPAERVRARQVLHGKRVSETTRLKIQTLGKNKNICSSLSSHGTNTRRVTLLMHDLSLPPEQANAGIKRFTG